MNLKTYLFNFVKIIVVFLCFYIVRDKLTLETFEKISNYDVLYFFLSIIIFFISQLLLGIRLSLSSYLFKANVSNLNCIKYSFISKLYSLFGFFSIVSEVNKFFLLKKEISQKKKIVKIILLDRFIGVTSLLFILLIAFIIFFLNLKIFFYISTLFLIFCVLIFLYSKKYKINFNLNFFKQLFLMIFVSIFSWMLVIFSSYIFLNESLELDKILIFGILISSLSLIIPITPFGIGSSQLIIVYYFEKYGIDSDIGFIFVSYIQFMTILLITFVSIPLNIRNYFLK